MEEIFLQKESSEKTKAYLQLLFVAFGWSVSTVLIKLYINELPSFHFLMARFFLGTMFILVTSFNKIKDVKKEDLKIGGVLGFLTFAAYAFGVIALKYTTASKSGFLVALSVLFIPIIETSLRKVMPSKWTILSILLSLIGLRLVSGMDGNGFNLGDALSLGSAITYTLYILVLDRLGSERDDFILTFVQLATVTILSSLCALFEGFNITQLASNFWPILFIGIFATGLSVLLQTKAQKVASSESVGVILLGEPLFVFIMAYFILHEPIYISGAIGCVLLMISLLIAILKKI